MRILLVEDEPDLGRAIKRTLTQEAYVVDWVQSGTEAIAFLEQGEALYTVGVFDWMLPGVSGLDLCRWLRSRALSLPVLMLTAKDEVRDRIAGLDAGADDYLVKPFSMAELLARLRALRRRSPEFKPTGIQIGPLLLDCDRRVLMLQAPSPQTRSLRSQKINPQQIDAQRKNIPKRTTTDPPPLAEPQQIVLTQKEFQLLNYLMAHPGQILTRDQLLAQLWEIGAEPNSNVVAAQMRLLRRKLGKYGTWIETVYGMGYRFNLPEASSTDSP